MAEQIPITGMFAFTASTSVFLAIVAFMDERILTHLNKIMLQFRRTVLLESCMRWTPLLEAATDSGGYCMIRNRLRLYKGVSRLSMHPRSINRFTDGQNLLNLLIQVRLIVLNAVRASSSEVKAHNTQPCSLTLRVMALVSISQL